MDKYIFIGKYLSPEQRKKRIVISLCIFVVYSVVQLITYMLLQNEVVFSLCVVPFIIIGWLLGPWSIAALGIIEYAFTFFSIIFIFGHDRFIQLLGRGMIMNMVVILVGMLVGRLSDLRQKAILMAKQLENVKEEKTRFFINLAHETKTPLILIDNYLKKYIQKKGTDPDLTVMSRNIEKLKQNMINFLDYEKLERGQEFYNHGNITDLSLILENSVKLFKEMAVQ